MIRSARLACFALAPLAALAGCALHRDDLPLVSTRPLAAAGVDLDLLPRRPVRAEEHVWFFLFIPLGAPPKAPAAIEKALANSGSDLLLDAEVTREAWSAIVVSRVGYVVEGEGVDLPAERGR